MRVKTKSWSFIFFGSENYNNFRVKYCVVPNSKNFLAFVYPKINRYNNRKRLRYISINNGISLKHNKYPSITNKKRCTRNSQINLTNRNENVQTTVDENRTLFEDVRVNFDVIGLISLVSSHVVLREVQ